MKRKSQKTLEISSRLYKIDIATLKTTCLDAYADAGT